MDKIANLYIEDFFAWGIWQKICITGVRYITFTELENFAHEVGKVAKANGYKFTTNFSKDLTIQFFNKYKNYITHDKNSITLNDSITYEELLNIFNMGVVSYDIVKIMLDKNIGKKVFVEKEVINV